METTRDVAVDNAVMVRKGLHAEEPAPGDVRARVLDSIGTAARRDGFELDPAQVVAAEVLADLAVRLSRRESPAVYLWGPVGRGKTWLIDAFLGSLPAVQTRRFHFHKFFRLFHEALGRHRPPHAVLYALDDLVGDAELICFDELYAHETGDAKLFTAILGELRERRRMPMIVTSNYRPDGLLPDAEFKTSGSTWEEPFVKVSHKMFEPGIELIKRSFEVVPLDNGVDYRGLAARTFENGFRSGTYIVRAAAETYGADVARVISIRGRSVKALAASQDHVVFDFVDLCERPVGAGDVAELAERFPAWRIENVPKLSACSPEAAQRFVNFSTSYVTPTSGSTSRRASGPRTSLTRKNRRPTSSAFRAG